MWYRWRRKRGILRKERSSAIRPTLELYMAIFSQINEWQAGLLKHGV